MDKRYLREWTSLIPEPPAYFDLGRKLNKSKTKELDTKSSKKFKKTPLKGRSTTTYNAFSMPMEQEYSKPSSSPSSAANFSASITMKHVSPIMKSQIRMKKADIMTKETKSMFRNVNKESKSYDNEKNIFNLKQMKKKAESREFNPTKFSTPSKNYVNLYDSQIESDSCLPNKPSLKDGIKGQGPASKKCKSPRSLVYSQGALKKKLSSIQTSQPAANTLEINTSKINNIIGKTHLYNQDNLRKKVLNVQGYQQAENFISSKTGKGNKDIRKMDMDPQVMKKLKRSKPSLRNLRHEVSPSPSSTTSSSSETETSSEDSEMELDMNMNLTRLSNSSGTFSSKNASPEKALRMVYEQQIHNKTESEISMMQYKMDKRIPEENIENHSKGRNSIRASYTKNTLQNKKRSANFSMVNDIQPSIHIQNLQSKEISFEREKIMNMYSQTKQLNKTKYANEENLKEFVDDSISKKVGSLNTKNSNEFKEVVSVIKGKSAKQPGKIEGKHSNHTIPQKKRKAMFETDQQANTLPLKKLAKQNVFREFRGEDNIEKSPGQKNSREVSRKGKNVNLTKSNSQESIKNRVDKKTSKDRFSAVSESDDHGELNSSGYMSKASQDLTHEDDHNNPAYPTKDSIGHNNNYTNLFFKDGKKIYKNVLKRNSRILGEAIAVINNSDLVIDLGLKKCKTLIDNYLDNPNSALPLFESKFDKAYNVPNMNMELQKESPISNNSCELEQVEITMTVESSDKTKKSVGKGKCLTPCTVSKDTIKQVKHEKVCTDSSPSKKMQRNGSSYKVKEIQNISKKRKSDKINSASVHDKNVEPEDLNSVTNNSTLMTNNSTSNNYSSTSDDTSASSSSESSSAEEDVVNNELLDEKKKTKTDKLNDTISSNHPGVGQKYPLTSMDVIDASKKSNTMAKKVLSDLDLSSESSEEEENINKSMNTKVTKQANNEYLSESNSVNISEEKCSKIESVEKIEDLNIRIESLEKTNDLRITIQGENKEILDEHNHNKNLEENEKNNTFPNDQFPWTTVLNDDLPLNEKNSPLSSKKHKISWNKRKEWDNDFQDSADELDDDHSEDIGSFSKFDNDYSDEEIVKEREEYDTELDYEVDEISEEEKEKWSIICKEPTSLKQGMMYNVGGSDSSEDKNVAVSERFIQDEDVLSLHAESLFSQDENDGCCDDMGINNLQENFSISTNSVDQGSSSAQTSNIIQDVVIQKQNVEANPNVDKTTNLHAFEENVELTNMEDHHASSEHPREESQPIWEGMLSPQADHAKFNLCAFPVSGGKILFDEILSNEIEVSALVEIHMVHSFLARSNSKSKKNFVIVKFEPLTSDDRQSYKDFLLSLLANKQYAVIGNCDSQVKHFYVVPVPAQQSVPDVFLPFDGPGLNQCSDHVLIGVMIFSKHFAQGRNENKDKELSKRIPYKIEEKSNKDKDKDENRNSLNVKEDRNNKKNTANHAPYKSTKDVVNDDQNMDNTNSDTYQMPCKPMDTINTRQNDNAASYTCHVPQEPEMDDMNGHQTMNLEYDEGIFPSHLKERYYNDLSGPITPEYYLNDNMSPTATLAHLSQLIQQALSENEEEQAWEFFDIFVASYPSIPSLGLEAMIPIARLTLTSDVVLQVPENIKHYLDGAKVVVLCELSKGDEAYALFRICYLYLPVTIKQTVTYSFIRFCGNHKMDDNESPWTKVQNWGLENPSCILTEHQKAVKELLESTWLEFHIDSKNADKVWNIYISLCSEMHKCNYFFKKLTIMVIEFFNDIGYAKMAYCVLEEVRRLQAADVEIFTHLIPLTFEPNISINLSSELLFTCEVVIELRVVLPKHDIEGLMKFFTLIDKVDIAIRLAILSIKSSVLIDITVIEEVVRRFDCMTHSLGKLYELLKLLKYANLRFLKPSLNKSLNPTGHSRTSLNFHQNKLISNIQEYYREHVFISLKGDDCQITPTKIDNEKEAYLFIKSPQDIDKKSIKNRKCLKSPTKNTIKKLEFSETNDKAIENKTKFESIYPQTLVMKNIHSKEIESQNDKIINELDINSVLSTGSNKKAEEMENKCFSSTICNDVTYPLLSKNPLNPIESVLKSLSNSNKVVELSTKSSLEHLEREKELQEWHVSKDLQENKPACVSSSTDIKEYTKAEHVLKEEGILTNSINDTRNKQYRFNDKTNHNKHSLMNENCLQEKNASSHDKTSSINEMNWMCSVDKLPYVNLKDIPGEITKSKEQQPLGQENLSSLGNYSPMKLFKQSLKATSKNFNTKNEVATLHSKINDNQEQFSSPFGKRKIIKRPYSKYEHFKRQHSTFDNSQWQGLSVTVETPHDKSGNTQKSVFIDNKDNQIKCKPHYSNKDSISTDKIAQRALEILNKNRLLRNLPKHIKPSQIMKKFQDPPLETDSKLPENEYDKSKVKILGIDSNTDRESTQENCSRDPRLNRKLASEENIMKPQIHLDTDIKNIQDNNQISDSNELDTLKETSNKYDDILYNSNNLEILEEKQNENEDLHNLSTITAASSAGSTPPLEIDEELESTNAENIEMDSSTAEKIELEKTSGEIDSSRE